MSNIRSRVRYPDMSFIRSQGADLSDDDADDDEEDEDGWETVDDDEEAAEAEAGAGTLPVDQLFERALSVSATGADADPRYATAADGCAASAAPLAASKECEPSNAMGIRLKDNTRYCNTSPEPQ